MLVSEDGHRMTVDEYQEALLDSMVAGSYHLLDGVALGSYYTGNGVWMSHSSIRADSIGYDQTMVDAEIHNLNSLKYGFRGPNTFGEQPVFVAALGTFSPPITRKALENQEEWPFWARESFTSGLYQGVATYDWDNGVEFAEDYVNSSPHLDMRGRALSMGIADTQLFVGSTLNEVELMIDSSLNYTETLHDIEDLNLIVQAMSELESFCFFIFSGRYAVDTSPLNPFRLESMFKQYEFAGIGPAQDEFGPCIALALIHEDTETANENAEILEERLQDNMMLLGTRWRDYFSDYEINLDGKIITAKFYSEDAWKWVNWYEGNFLAVEY